MTGPNDATPPGGPPPAPAPAGRGTVTQPERSLAGLGLGLITLAIGVWYFLDQTLGLDMPRIDWRAAWPVVLIVLGGVLVLRSAGRRG